jgi:hypothetical protein
MGIQLEQLRGKMTKLNTQTIYELFLQNLAAQYKRSNVLCKHRSQVPSLDVTLALDKSHVVTNLQNASMAVASLDINIHE